MRKSIDEMVKTRVIRLKGVFCDVIRMKMNKAGYTATLVACGWAGAVIEKVTGAFGQKH